MIQGETYGRSTKTVDKKLAESMSTLWEAEIIKNVMAFGRKPMNLHAALAEFLKEREGKKGHDGAAAHLPYYYELPDIASTCSPRKWFVE